MSELRIIKRYLGSRCYYIPQVKRTRWFGFGDDYWCDFSVSEYDRIYYFLLSDWTKVYDKMTHAEYQVRQYLRLTGEPEVVWTNEEKK